MKTKKTLSDFIANCSNPVLFKKVFRAGGVSFKDFKENPNDYYVANTGSVAGMIYYCDTERFAKDNIELILELIEQLQDEGLITKIEPSLNWLTWLTWEAMAGELISYLED